MVGSIDVYSYSYGTDHLTTENPNTEHGNVWFSNGFGFRMVGIQAPTVNGPNT